MDKLNFDKKTLKKFGVTMGAVFLLVTFFILINHHFISYFILGVSLGFFIFGLTVPGYLKPVYLLWMKFASILGWINTRIILFTLFYLVFTPIGLLMRVFGKDTLGKKSDKHKPTYWKKREKKVFSLASFERQF